MTAGELQDVKSGSERHRVLLVDDDADLRSMLRRLLSPRRRFEVVGEAGDGSEAIRLAAKLQPDITVLDLMMPMSGEAALPHLLTAAPSCMVVVFSALDPSAHRERLLAAGAFACYSKDRPAEIPHLLARDLQRFRQALDGEEAIVSWAARRRPR